MASRLSARTSSPHMDSKEQDPLLAGPSDSSKAGYYRDPESLEEVPLVPGMSKAENMLRWGFIRKVYGIISCQLILTTLVAGAIMLNPPLQQFCATNVPFRVVMFLAPLVGLIPLYAYQDRHPVNLALLGVWTAAISVSVGVACSMYPSLVVLEAVALTALVVVSLTAYTFRAVRKGQDFTFMAPALFTSLCVLVGWSFIQFVFPLGPIGQTVFALGGAILFALYLIMDTHLLIEKFSYDQYVWASVTLYLDIINLFLKILSILGNRQ